MIALGSVDSLSNKKRIQRIEKIVEIMSNPINIRNIGLIGHIDHGKTTLSDSLIAEAGLLSKDLAGEARVLDYWEEEQRRGITMKSTNISLYYESSLKDRNPFVINLVDTPGHLDFTGKVTRALRLIDGVIIIVDAVEEVSPQTETVLRQSLEEGIKPLLFINKIDRLFTELELENEQIKQKLNRIIANFNDLIDSFKFQEMQFKWKVKSEDGTVLFGSALHGWGFSIKQLVSKALNFSKLREFYSTQDKNKRNELKAMFPIHKAILDAVITHLPNPIQAQAYRVPIIWEGNENSELFKSMLKCDANGPLVLCVQKVERESFGLVATARIFSGTLDNKKEVFLVNENKVEKINQLSIFMGAHRDHADHIPAGNIAAVIGPKMLRSGETLIEKEFKEEAQKFKFVKYVSEPVMTIAIEPMMLKDLNNLQEQLQDFLIEDPNLELELSQETGECLLSGIGPLHLEVVVNQLKKRGVEVEVSKPQPIFKESVHSNTKYVIAKSPNGLNICKLLVTRLNQEDVKWFRNHASKIPKDSKLRFELLKTSTSLSELEVKGFWAEIKNTNIIISRRMQDLGIYIQEESDVAESLEGKQINIQEQDQSKKPIAKDFATLDEPLRKQIIEIIENVCSKGILVNEPLAELKIVIRKMDLDADPKNRNIFELTTMISSAFAEALRNAQPRLLEPIYEVIITSPLDYIGIVPNTVIQYLGKITKINQSDRFFTLECLLPVRKALEFGQDLRSQTSARAFWQSRFAFYEEVPKNEEESIIQSIRLKKGLVRF